MAFRQIKSPALADKAVINSKLDESAVQGQSTLTGMANPADCFTLLYDVGTDSLKKITADAFFSSFSTTDLSEGTNLYFTDQRASTAVASDIASAVLVESNRASAAETLVQANLTAEASTRAQADVTLQSNLTAEATRAGLREDTIEAASQSADTALNTRINDLISNTDSAALDSLTEIVAAFQDADGVLSASVIANSSAITTELSRALAAETVIAGDLSVETARATAAEVANTSLLSAEETARIAADTALSARVTVEEQATVSLQAQVTAEVSRAGAAEVANATAVADEIVRATGAEAANAQSITDEIAARAVAVTQARTDLGGDIVTAQNAAQAHAEAQDTLMIGDVTVDGSATNTISDRIATAKSEAIAASTSSSSVENAARIAGDAALQSSIDAEEARATAAEAVNATSITTEVAARIAGDSSLQSQIDFITDNTDSASLDSLTEIVAAFQSADSDMSALVGSNTTAISTEKARAEAAEAVNAAAVVTEASTRGTADTGLQTAITTEETARIAADAATLASAKSHTDAEADSHQAAAEAHADAQDTALIGDASVNGTVGNTVTARIATAKSEATAFTTAQVSAEAATRLAADDALSLRTTVLEGEMTTVEALAAQNEIDLRAEEGVRSANIIGLVNAIDGVEAARILADSGLQSQVTAEVARAQGVESTNAASVVTEKNRAEGVEAGLRADVNTNTTDISTNAGAVNAERVRALAAELVNATAITTENTRAIAAEGLLTTNLATLDTTVGNILSNTDSAALDSLTEIVAAFQSADNDMDGVITANSGRLTVNETDIDAVEVRATAVEGRATAVEGRATALETEQTLQGGRLTVNEGDIDDLETKLGSGTFDTTSQIITGSINELHTETSANTTGLAAAVARADADSDALAALGLDVDALEIAIGTSITSDIAASAADYIARDAVVLASAQTYAESEADDAEAAAKTYADGIVAGEATLRENADTALTGQITTEATARQNADNALDSRATVVEGEMTATQLAAGVNADGTYAVPTTTNYINASASLADADKKLDTAIKTADTARVSGDASLQALITAEEVARTAGDSDLTVSLATEVARATAAEAANGVLITANAASIASESSRAQGVESSLQTQVDFITDNTDSAALDSLTEIVAAFQAADGTLTGVVNQNQLDIATNAASVVTEATTRASQDAAVRSEFAAADTALQTAIDTKVSKSGGTMSGDLAMGGNKVSGLALGTVDADAVNKGQMDVALAAQHISAKSTTDLSEGTNQYFTPTRVHDAVSVVDVSGEGKVSETAGVFSIDTAKSFLEISDVADTSYTGKNGFVARVKNDLSGLELIDPSQLAFNDAKRQVISGDGAQTMFALDFYTQEANAMVFVGGVIQDPSVHYTIDAVNQQITFMAAIPVGTQAVVIAQSTNSVGVLDPKSVGLETLADNIKVFEQGNDVIAGTSATVVSTFNKTVTRSAKYVVTVESGGEFETRECLVIHNGSNAYITEYGILFTGSDLLGDTDVQVNGSSVELTYTAVSAGAVVSVSATYVDA